MSLKKGEVIFIFPRENTVSYSTYRQSSDAIAITDKTISTLSNNFEMFREPLGGCPRILILLYNVK